MNKHWMFAGLPNGISCGRSLILGLALCVAVFGGHSAASETWRLRGGETLEVVTDDPQEQYLHAMAELKMLVQEGNPRAVRAALAQLKDEYPDRIGPDLELFLLGEVQYWRNYYTQALTQYEKLLKDFPGSEYAGLALQRQFEMAEEYLQGRKKFVLGIFRFSAFEDGVQIMEKISDRAGLSEPNGIGLRAAIAIAEQYEAKGRFLEAALKWSEIASYWEAGPIGKRALYQMAENNLAAYERRSPERRPHYDASKLLAARTYYERFLLLYPEEARENEVPQKIQEIDEQMAWKQYSIGRFYEHTRKHRAANLYFDMVAQNWPRTQAGALAQEALEGSRGADHDSGK